MNKLLDWHACLSNTGVISSETFYWLMSTIAQVFAALVVFTLTIYSVWSLRNRDAIIRLKEKCDGYSILVNDFELYLMSNLGIKKIVHMLDKEFSGRYDMLYKNYYNLCLQEFKDLLTQHYQEKKRNLQTIKNLALKESYNTDALMAECDNMLHEIDQLFERIDGKDNPQAIIEYTRTLRCNFSAGIKQTRNITSALQNWIQHNFNQFPSGYSNRRVYSPEFWDNIETDSSYLKNLVGNYNNILKTEQKATKILKPVIIISILVVLLSLLALSLADSLAEVFLPVSLALLSLASFCLGIYLYLLLIILKSIKLKGIDD